MVCYDYGGMSVCEEIEVREEVHIDSYEFNPRSFKDWFCLGFFSIIAFCIWFALYKKIDERDKRFKKIRDYLEVRKSRRNKC